MYSKYFLNSTISKPEKRVRAAREELNARRHVKNDKDMVLVGLLVGYCVPYFISFLLILIGSLSLSFLLFFHFNPLITQSDSHLSLSFTFQIDSASSIPTL